MLLPERDFDQDELLVFFVLPSSPGWTVGVRSGRLTETRTERVHGKTGRTVGGLDSFCTQFFRNTSAIGRPNYSTLWGLFYSGLDLPVQRISG